MSSAPESKQEVARVIRALLEHLNVRPIDIAHATESHQTHVQKWKKGQSRIGDKKWRLLLDWLNAEWGIPESVLKSQQIESLLDGFRVQGRVGNVLPEPPENGFDPDKTVAKLHFPTGNHDRPTLTAELDISHLLRLDQEQNPGDDIPAEHIRHLGPPHSPLTLGYKTIRAIALDKQLCISLGIRRDELVVLDQVELPAWADRPRIWMTLLFLYREAVAAGDVELSFKGEDTYAAKG